MINGDDIKKIRDLGLVNKFEIRLKDITYCLLLYTLSDIKIAYKMAHGIMLDDIEVTTYNESDLIIWLKSQLKEHIKSSDDTTTYITDISFEENKTGQIELLAKLDSYVQEGRIKEKDAIDLENKIRSNLVSKFNTSKRADEQYIIVNTKFNDVCHKCGAEILSYTKELAMKEWNLIEQNNG